eukprot:gene22697-29852_t
MEKSTEKKVNTKKKAGSHGSDSAVEEDMGGKKNEERNTKRKKDITESSDDSDSSEEEKEEDKRKKKKKMMKADSSADKEVVIPDFNTIRFFRKVPLGTPVAYPSPVSGTYFWEPRWRILPQYQEGTSGNPGGVSPSQYQEGTSGNPGGVSSPIIRKVPLGTPVVYPPPVSVVVVVVVDEEVVIPDFNTIRFFRKVPLGTPVVHPPPVSVIQASRPGARAVDVVLAGTRYAPPSRSTVKEAMKFLVVEAASIFASAPPNWKIKSTFKPPTAKQSKKTGVVVEGIYIEGKKEFVPHEERIAKLLLLLGTQK